MGARAVFLVGFMASGKSTVGRELARRLSWEFVDLDAHIETRERQTVPDIFRDRGELGFRAAETTALQELTKSFQRDSIVALGGGAFIQQTNRDLLRTWPTVFLHAAADELWQRCSEDTAIRPLRQDREQFAQLYADRLPYYREATIEVNTSGEDPASICAEIEASLQLSDNAGKTRSPERGGSR